MVHCGRAKGSTSGGDHDLHVARGPRRHSRPHVPAAPAGRRVGRAPGRPHRPAVRPDAGAAVRLHARLPAARRHVRRRQRPEHPQPRRQRGRHLVRPAPRGRRLGAARPAGRPARRVSGLRRHGACRRLRDRPGGLGRGRPRLHRAHHPPRRRRRLPQRAHGIRGRLPDLAGPRAAVRQRHAPDRPARLGERHCGARQRSPPRRAAPRSPSGSSSDPGRASGRRSTSSRSSSRTGTAARSRSGRRSP